MINLHTKFEVPIFTHFRDMIRAQNLKVSHVTLTTPIWHWLLVMVYLCTKFEDLYCSFTHSKDMNDSQNVETGFEMVRVTRSSAALPFDKAYINLYSTFLVTWHSG